MKTKIKSCKKSNGCFLKFNFLLKLKARFHYEREKKHSWFLLLIFPSLKLSRKLKRALSKAKKK